MTLNCNRCLGLRGSSLLTLFLTAFSLFAVLLISSSAAAEVKFRIEKMEVGDGHGGTHVIRSPKLLVADQTKRVLLVMVCNISPISSDGISLGLDGARNLKDRQEGTLMIDKTTIDFVVVNWEGVVELRDGRINKSCYENPLGNDCERLGDPFLLPSTIELLKNATTVVVSSKLNARTVQYRFQLADRANTRSRFFSMCSPTGAVPR